MKSYPLYLVLLAASRALAGDEILRTPATREPVAVVTVTTWSNGDRSSTLRDPIFRQPQAVLDKSSFGTTVRDPVTRETMISKK